MLSRAMPRPKSRAMPLRVGIQTPARYRTKAAPYKIVYNFFPVRWALLFPKQDAVMIGRDLLHYAGPA